MGKKPCLSLRELEKQIGYDLDTLSDLMGKNITVGELVERYLCTKTEVKPNTLANYNFVQNLLKEETFSEKKISQIKTSDAKLFLIKLQQDGKGSAPSKQFRESSGRHSRWRWMMMCCIRTHSALNWQRWW